MKDILDMWQINELINFALNRCEEVGERLEILLFVSNEEKMKFLQ